MTLEEIKDRIAEESLYRDWVAFINNQPNWKVEEIMDEVAKRYATEAIKADRASLANDPDWYFEPDDRKRIVNRPIELK